MSILPFTLMDLINSLLVIFIFLILGKIITVIFQKYIKKWAAKTKSTVDDLIVAKIKPPFSYFIWFLGIKVALQPLNLDYEIVDRILNTIILAIIIYAITVLADIIIKGILEHVAAKTKSTMDDALLPLLDKTAKAIIILIGLMWALGIWHIDITPILASLGIAGLALGFAVKDSLANIFGGISLILDRVIKVGDRVKLESGEKGNIIDLGLRSTKLRTFNNEIIIIPNGQLANSRLQNFGQPDPSLRITIDFGVGYESDVDLVRRIVGEAIRSLDGVMDDPPIEVLFLAMGDFALNFSARFWVDDFNIAWDKELEATDKIFHALKDAKINIPYPIQTIKLDKAN